MNALEITSEFYGLWGRGKVAQMIERFIAAQSVLDNPLPEPIRFAGSFEGPTGFALYARQILETLKVEKFSIDEILVDGERVVVIGRETSRVLATNKRYTMAWVHVLTVRNGCVEHMREYNDTAAMAAAFV